MPFAALASSSSIIAPIQYTLPSALLLTGVLITYWFFACTIKPRSRRRIRRANTLVLLVLSWFTFYAASIADYDLAPKSFVIAWIGVLGLTVLSGALAAFDSANNIRVHRKYRRQRRADRRAQSSALNISSAAALDPDPHPDRPASS